MSTKRKSKASATPKRKFFTRPKREKKSKLVEVAERTSERVAEILAEHEAEKPEKFSISYGSTKIGEFEVAPPAPELAVETPPESISHGPVVMLDTTSDDGEKAKRTAAAKKAWETIRARRAAGIPATPRIKLTVSPEGICPTCGRGPAKAATPKPPKPLKFRKSPRKLKADISDEAVIARNAEATAACIAKYGVPYRPTDLSKFCTPGYKCPICPKGVCEYGRAREQGCVYCNGIDGVRFRDTFTADSRRMGSVTGYYCDACVELISEKRGVWAEVNEQKTTYAEAMAAKTAATEPPVETSPASEAA